MCDPMGPATASMYRPAPQEDIPTAIPGNLYHKPDVPFFGQGSCPRATKFYFGVGKKLGKVPGSPSKKKKKAPTKGIRQIWG